MWLNNLALRLSVCNNTSSVEQLKFPRPRPPFHSYNPSSPVLSKMSFNHHAWVLFWTELNHMQSQNSGGKKSTMGCRSQYKNTQTGHEPTILTIQNMIDNSDWKNPVYSNVWIIHHLTGNRRRLVSYTNAFVCSQFMFFPQGPPGHGFLAR